MNKSRTTRLTNLIRWNLTFLLPLVYKYNKCSTQSTVTMRVNILRVFKKMTRVTSCIKAKTIRRFCLWNLTCRYLSVSPLQKSHNQPMTERIAIWIWTPLIWEKMLKILGSCRWSLTCRHLSVSPSQKSLSPLTIDRIAIWIWTPLSLEMILMISGSCQRNPTYLCPSTAPLQKNLSPHTIDRTVILIWTPLT